MKTDEIRLLYDYNAWADARILAACARVSPEQYAAPTTIGTGRGGLRATMVHMLDNLWQWRITLQGYYREPLADEAAYDATELHEDDILMMPEPAYYGGTTTREVSSADIIRAVAERGREALHIAERAACGDKLVALALPGDRIVIMGARDDTLSEFAASVLQRLA